MKILLVEDDEILVENLTATLGSQNHLVESVTDGIEGLEYAQATPYDLIVLDVNLPGLDGVSLCRQLRQTHYKGFILLLTAEGDSHRKIIGLDAGADDYVVKPCLPEELSARIRALLRRPRDLSSTVLHWGRLHLDPSSCTVLYEGAELSLSPKEYSLLELFLRNPQRIFSSAALLERLWGFDETPGEETVRTHIKRLRQKLKRAGITEIIENIYGMGYRLVEPPEVPAAESVAAVAMPENATIASSPVSPAAQAAARSEVASTLGQFSDLIRDRMAQLDRAAAALQTGTLSAALRREAQAAAHKLSGSLGMFGVTDGSRLSQQLEAALEAAGATTHADHIQATVTQLREIVEAALTAADSTSPAPSADSPPPPPETPLAAVHADQATASIETVSNPPALATRCRQGTAKLTAPTLLLIAADRDRASAIASAASPFCEVVSVAAIEQAQLAPDQLFPDAVLIDLTAEVDVQSLQLWLTRLSQTEPMPSVWVVTAPDAFQLRLTLARCCVCTFLSDALAAKQIVQTVVEMFQRGESSPPKILAVDDDPVVLTALKERLSPWGMDIATLSDTRQFWQCFSQLRPDLLLLDIEMPEVSGIELCQVIRSDRQWDSLPILFLTARQDRDTIQRTYQAGADDYIAKPFSEAELATRILNRLERQHQLQQSTVLDTVTGLLPKHHALTNLERDLAIAQRYRKPYCLAIVAVTEVLDSPSTTPARSPDDFLRAVAQALNAKLRQEDILAQTAHHTFIVGMYGIQRQQAVNRLRHLENDLHEAISRGVDADSQHFQVKTGFAIAPDEGGDLFTLRQIAESRLNPPRLSSSFSSKDDS